MVGLLGCPELSGLPTAQQLVPESGGAVRALVGCVTEGWAGLFPVTLLHRAAPRPG